MILDYYSGDTKIFRPTNVEEYTLLQIVGEFNAISNLKSYLLVIGRYPLSKIIQAYRTAKLTKNKESTFFQGLNH